MLLLKINRRRIVIVVVLSRTKHVQTRVLNFLKHAHTNFFIKYAVRIKIGSFSRFILHERVYLLQRSLEIAAIRVNQWAKSTDRGGGESAMTPPYCWVLYADGVKRES